MKHWFVNWLDDMSKKKLQKAEKFHHEGLDWAEYHEEIGYILRDWSYLVTDMIDCGLEDLAMKYYDVKQSIIPHKLPPRPNRNDNRKKIDDIAESINARMNSSCDQKQLEKLKVIYITYSELVTTGFRENAIPYYLRKRKEYPELKLPEVEE